MISAAGGARAGSAGGARAGDWQAGPDGGARAGPDGGARAGPDGGARAGDWQAGSVRAHHLAAEAIALLIARGQTVAVAESLTGGMLAAALTSIPGASAVFRGGVVTYATDLKSLLLGVPAALLARHGAVHPAVAVAMAAGARRQLVATAGVATTGVAGPDLADGQPVGTVHIAVCAGRRKARRALALSGSRNEIRMATVEHALGLLIGTLREEDA